MKPKNPKPKTMTMTIGEKPVGTTSTETRLVWSIASKCWRPSPGARALFFDRRNDAMSTIVELNGPRGSTRRRLREMLDGLLKPVRVRVTTTVDWKPKP
jgi:hypothetical protein